MLDRAYGFLEIKSFDEESRTIEGIATTPEPDRRGDVIDPAGAEFVLPMPLLWQHRQDEPIGQVIAASVTPAGIAIKAVLANVGDPGPLRDRLNEAWQSIRSKLVRGLSVGFRPIEAVPRKKGDPFGGMLVRRWSWAETSAVTIPMNVAATILSIKSAALGHDSNPLGAASSLPVVRVDARTMKTYAEQITDHETRRAAVVASMADLMGKDEGATLGEADTTKYNEYSLQVKSLDAHLTRLREMDALNASAAKPVDTTKASGVPDPRPNPVVVVKSELPKGTAFVRGCMAILEAKGDLYRAERIAQRWKDSTPEVELMIKAAVAPGTTTDPAWAGALVTVSNLTNEFIELLRPATILGKIPNLRRVPFNAQIPIQTAGGSYGWVGQAKPKPVTKLGFGTASLGMSKVAGIIVLTEELVKLSSPSAEAIVRSDMIAGIAQFLDQQLIDPAVAEVANVSPASITNGATTAASTDTAAGDLARIVAHFAAQNAGVAGITLIMSEVNALAMGMLRDGNGGRAFPGMSANGGTAEGLTVIASNAAGTNVIGLMGQGILLADEGGVAIDVSREASVQMDSAPMAVPDATTVLVSLWQNNLVGLRAERMINWKRAVQGSVIYLTDAVYPAVVAPAAA